jgi:dipeptidyl aminopeptidase/acylaminoacyl peptidase
MRLLFASAVATGAPPSTTMKQLAPAEELTFTSKHDGAIEKYIQRLPPNFNAAQPHDVLIALHGHGATRTQYSDDPRGECRGARDVAAKHGLIFISPDYRGASWMGPAAEADMAQLIGELKQRHNIRKVFITGASMGGTAALIFTALHPQLVAGVASLNGIANLTDYQTNYAGIYDAIVKAYGGAATEVPAEYRKRSPLFFPEKFTMPVAIVVSGNDTIVPAASTIQLAEAIQKINQRVLFIYRPNAGHATNYEDTVAAIEFVVTAQ